MAPADPMARIKEAMTISMIAHHANPAALTLEESPLDVTAVDDETPVTSTPRSSATFAWNEGASNLVLISVAKLSAEDAPVDDSDVSTVKLIANMYVVTVQLCYIYKENS